MTDEPVLAHDPPRAAFMNSASPIPEVEFKRVDIVFGEQRKSALNLLDAGKSREEILEQTGAVIGVCGASIAIQKGEICVLMGLSGSGKSTLLRAVNGLNHVTRGQVLLNQDAQQLNIASASASQLRQVRMDRISMVFQQFALMPWRTVAENVGFGLEIRGTAKAQRQTTIDEMLDMVGLIQWRDKYAHELSGGMQQRVGLARAFATDADILLMDEPFSALDPLIRSRLQDELLDLQERLHKTVLFVSHDLDEALKLGNCIAIMEGGRVVQFDIPEKIVLNPVNQYVSDFVAHMNPVGVLKAKSIMSAVTKYAYGQNGIYLQSADIRVSRNGSGGIDEARSGDGVLTVKAWAEGVDVDTGCLYTASVGISMKNAIEIRHASANPVLLTDADDAVVGVIDDDEIYNAILHKRSQMRSQCQSA